MLHLCSYFPAFNDPTVQALNSGTYITTTTSQSCERALKSHDELSHASIYSTRDLIEGYALHAFSTSRCKDPPARSFTFSPTSHAFLSWPTKLGAATIYSGRESQ